MEPPQHEELAYVREHFLCLVLSWVIFSTGLTIRDILPGDPSKYDKMRPPKRDGNPTIVYFHVTVMGLDSIDENSMVNLHGNKRF